ncbi:hypothetical protein AVEN_203380-1, partial [Araneus ventricosus]
MANVGKRKAFSIGAEKHGVNAFSQNEIEHFECCGDDVITSGEKMRQRIKRDCPAYLGRLGHGCKEKLEREIHFTLADRAKSQIETGPGICG